MKNNSIKLLFGVGNPGVEYENTYHNVGIQALRFFAKKNGVDLNKPSRKKFTFAKTEKGILAESLVFMNNSGESAGEACAFFDVNPHEFAVIHDDSDLILGEHKIVFGGSSAGHKGIESISLFLETQDFWKIRIGIRQREERRRRKAGEFVLNKIRPEEAVVLNQTFERIAEQLNI